MVNELLWLCLHVVGWIVCASWATRLTLAAVLCLDRGMLRSLPEWEGGRIELVFCRETLKGSLNSSSVTREESRSSRDFKRGSKRENSVKPLHAESERQNRNLLL